MKIQHHAALAAVSVLLSSTAALAQTTIITEQPAPATVVTPAPVVQQLELTPAQRTVIYRTIVQQQPAAQVVEERTVTPAPVEVQVGARVPATAQLYAIPETVVAQVPTVKAYRYMYVNHHVVLVDPATSTVVGEIVQ